MRRETWLSVMLVVSVVAERSLFWHISKTLPSFRYPIYLGVLVLNFLVVARKAGFAFVGRRARELFKSNIIGLATLTVLHGSLAMLSAGAMGEGWRAVLLMHVSSVVSLMEAVGSSKSVWTMPALLFLVVGSYGVVVSDKTLAPGVVYAMAWLIHGLGDRQRRRVLADEHLLSFTSRESILTLMIGIFSGPCQVYLNKFFPINKHAPEPVHEYATVMTQFPRCMTSHVPFLVADVCGWPAGLAVACWWLSHFACAAILLKLAAIRHPLDVAMTHTAGLLIATILLFTRMHAEDELLAALTFVVGLLCAHAAAEGDREVPPEVESSLLLRLEAVHLMTAEVEQIVETPLGSRRFAFFRVTRYGYFAVGASQTDIPVTLPFASLSQRLKTKFRNAGVRTSEQARAVEDAELLYLQIPRSARLSEEQVGDFLKTKDASHIKNHGGTQVARKDGFNPLNSAENLIWEDSRINRRRGGRDMTEAELDLARQALLSEGSGVFLTNAVHAGLRSAFITGTLEVPLVALEDFVARQGQISLTYVAKSAATAGLIGGLSGALLHAGLALVPESVLNSDAFKLYMLTLGSLGVAVYLWELAIRIKAVVQVKRPDASHLVTIVIYFILCFLNLYVCHSRRALKAIANVRVV